MPAAQARNPEIFAPLAFLRGDKPAAPAWFDHAISQAPEALWVECRGAKLEVLAWGQASNPGLLMMHGNGAHAGWWRFIAPFFADRFRVIAFSWSGMGRSDWRAEYAIENFVAEILSVCEATKVFDNAIKPVALAHSFGVGPLVSMAAQHGDRLRAGILVDAPILSPAEREIRRAERGWKSRPKIEARSHRVYSTLEAALARFRLAPLQSCANLYIADLIAREGLKRAQTSNGEEGWTWSFDPSLWRDYRGADLSQAPRSAACPFAVVFGERSGLMQAKDIELTRPKMPDKTPFIAIPDSDHHIMIDQPLALVACIETLLSAWAP